MSSVYAGAQTPKLYLGSSELLAGVKTVTQAEYDAMSAAEQENGLVYDVPKLSGAKDMTSVQAYCERNMSVTSDTDLTEIVWDGHDNIGANFYYTAAIDVTDLDYIEYDLTLGSCYGGGSTVMYDRWSFAVGVTQSVPFTGTVSNYENISFLTYKKYTNSNTTLSSERLDVSALTGQVYLTVYCPGWNAEISDVALVNNLDKLYYLGSEYVKE